MVNLFIFLIAEIAFELIKRIVLFLDNSKLYLPVFIN